MRKILSALLMITAMTIGIGVPFANPNQPPPHTKCGTANVLFSGDRTILDRPNLPCSRISESGRFEVHYNDYGMDATTEAFVDSALAILDAQWVLQIDSLGFQAPPMDINNRIHVYIINLRYYYGQTTPLRTSGMHVASYITCDNDYLDSTYPTRGLNGLRVTLAHEFFHVIQFGYRLDPYQISVYEWSSVWMEDVAYDPIDDYLWYLPSFFYNPYPALQTFNGTHEYGAAVFLFMVDQAYGREYIRETWERFALEGGEWFELLLTILEENGYDRYRVASDFLTWNLFTGARAVPGFGYEEAADYDSLVLLSDRRRIEYRKEFGYWGMQGYRVMDGVEGNPHFTVTPSDSVYTIAAIADNQNVTWIETPSGNSLHGAPCYAAVLSLRHLFTDLSVNFTPELTGPPSSISLSQGYPNPFSTWVVWDVELDRACEIRYDIFNILGQHVFGGRKVVDPSLVSYLTWDGLMEGARRVPSGTYILRVKAGSEEAYNKIIILPQ